MGDNAPGPGEFLLYETQDGKTRVECRFVDDLEAILSVGYRVRSARGTQFRGWATGRLSERRMYLRVREIFAMAEQFSAQRREALEAEGGKNAA